MPPSSKHPRAYDGVVSIAIRVATAAVAPLLVFPLLTGFPLLLLALLRKLVAADQQHAERGSNEFVAGDVGGPVRVKEGHGLARGIGDVAVPYHAADLPLVQPAVPVTVQGSEQALNMLLCTRRNRNRHPLARVRVALRTEPAFKIFQAQLDRTTACSTACSTASTSTRRSSSTTTTTSSGLLVISIIIIIIAVAMAVCVAAAATLPVIIVTIVVAVIVLIALIDVPESAQHPANLGLAGHVAASHELFDLSGIERTAAVPVEASKGAQGPL